MGYTHYWNQKRDYTKDQWKQICEDIQLILNDVEHVQGIPLANGNGDPGTHPILDANEIYFNGLGDDSHETFCVYKKRPPAPAHRKRSERGWDFCKTARKPYDLAVTACLSYLSSVVESHDVSSDGDGADFIEGVEEARRALPRYANILDIPMGVMQADRWCMPWVNAHQCDPYEVHFCVDGFGYVLCGKESYRFNSHQELAKWLDDTKSPAVYVAARNLGWGSSTPNREPNIWNAYGSFDERRHKHIAKLQKQQLGMLWPIPADRAHQPPAFVRPMQFPAQAERAYSFSDLLNLQSEGSSNATAA